MKRRRLQLHRKRFTHRLLSAHFCMLQSVENRFSALPQYRRVASRYFNYYERFVLHRECLINMTSNHIEQNPPRRKHRENNKRCDTFKSVHQRRHFFTNLLLTFILKEDHAGCLYGVSMMMRWSVLNWCSERTTSQCDDVLERRIWPAGVNVYAPTPHVPSPL